ncbi:MAG: FkbM family methyltransferase [Myxococcota bacterium]|nr:FkbM family methyltransferase [Myxococcota bacterium]
MTSTLVDYVGYLPRHADLVTCGDGPPEIVEAIRRDGYFVLERYLSPRRCDELVSEIDRLIEAHPERVRTFSDQRIFGAQTLTSAFDDFHGDPFLAALADRVMNAKTVNAFTLANRLAARPGIRGSGESWHKDHWFRQFKAILYLVDVDETNGPFQILPRSHRLGQYLKDMHAVGLPFRGLAVTDVQLGQLLHADPTRVRTVTAPKGSVILVDTACIHRGKPPVAGVRYALTSYFVERHQLSEAFIERFQPANADDLRRVRADDVLWPSTTSEHMRERTNQLLRSAKTFSFMLRRNPERALDILSLRIERRTGAPLHLLSGKRLATYMLERSHTQPVDGTLTEYGNYYLDASLVPEDPVVFSLGIGRDIRFDRAVMERHNPTLVMVDPTPSSRDFIGELDLPDNVSFHNIAVSREDGMLDVYPDELEATLTGTTSVSMHPHGFHDAAFQVPCKRVSTLMREHGVDRIDVFKADIEGAALGVLEDLLDQGIHPTQIAAELEKPQKFSEFASYLARMSALFTRLKKLGYDVYRTRETDRGCQIEVLAVRRRASGMPG